MKHRAKRVLLTGVTASLCWAGAPDKIVSGDPSVEALHVPYHMGQTPTIAVQLKWSTIIILPSSEKVLEFGCGFKDEWDVVAPAKSNYARIIPLKAGAKTDLMLVTESGNIYTFGLEDVSNQREAHASTQVLIDAVDDKMRTAMKDTPKYFSADDVAAFREQAKKAEGETEALRAQASRQKQEATDAARVEATQSMKFGYHFTTEAEKAPWNITAMYSNDKFTYVKAHPQESFAAYEIKDGKPVAVNIFPDGDGSFRFDRVIDAGRFRLGKKQIDFSR